jgi:hypothetical protein
LDVWSLVESSVNASKPRLPVGPRRFSPPFA